MNRAARIFAKNIRRRKAKRSATMKISPRFSPGNSRERTARSPLRDYIVSRSTSKPFISPSEATNELQTQSLAPERSTIAGETCRLRRAGHSAAGVVAGNARHRERASAFARRRTGRVRFRLPRRNLRNVLADRQRRSARTGSSRRRVRALHEKVSRWRHHRDRAVSGKVFSDREGSGRRSHGARPYRPSRWIYFRASWFGAGSEFNSDSEARCRSFDGS